MSIYKIFEGRDTPRHRRRKVARFMHRITPSWEMVACIFSFGVLGGFCVSKLLGVI